MKHSYFLLLLFILNSIYSSKLQGQVGIGTTPDTFTVFDIVSTDRGIMFFNPKNAAFRAG